MSINQAETYCMYHPKRLGNNSIGQPIQCGARLSLTDYNVGKHYCVECQKEIDAEKVSKNADRDTIKTD